MSRHDVRLPSARHGHQYRIYARDPDGTFVDADWSTVYLPRIGEQVMLPNETGGWQEMTVLDIAHRPQRIEPSGAAVWLGGSDGWEPGSVCALFERARSYWESELTR